MRILYFARDYTSHDHRFLSALAAYKRKALPPNIERIFFLRLEKRGHALEDRPLPPEVEQILWAGGRAPATFGAGPRLLADLRRVIRDVKPDIVQAGPVQRAAFLTALAGFQPLVTMSWGYDLLFDAHKNALWRWATRFTLKRSAAMVGDCDTIRKLAIAHGMDAARIVTFPWGVEIGHFRPVDDRQPPTAFSLQPSNFNILSTRGWEPIYGVDILARAFVQAAQARPELRLIMLGNGSLAAQLRQMFARGGVADRVVFPGQVGYADLPRYYRMADLYVSASHSDGASISLLEALACGRPVLVSDIPGNREWVRPAPMAPLPQREGSQTSGGAGGEEVGWTFPDGDAGALAEALLNAAAQRERLAEMGRAARRLAEDRGDWQKNFPRLFEAYALATKG